MTLASGELVFAELDPGEDLALPARLGAPSTGLPWCDANQDIPCLCDKGNLSGGTPAGCTQEPPCTSYGEQNCDATGQFSPSGPLLAILAVGAVIGGCVGYAWRRTAWGGAVGATIGAPLALVAAAVYEVESTGRVG
jgi:hypothetical protein